MALGGNVTVRLHKMGWQLLLKSYKAKFHYLGTAVITVVPPYLPLHIIMTIKCV